MLLGNYTVLNRSPMRFLGGSTASPEVNHQPNFYRGGSRKNRQYVEQTAAANKRFSLPYGSYTFYATLLPQQGGDLSARRSGDFVVTTVATGGLGAPGEGLATLSITTNAPEGQLIVSGSGTATLLISTNNPSLAATRNADGTATFSITCATAILGAEASVIGTATLTVTGNATASAVGIMEGTTEDTGLSPSGIANAVWSAIAAQNNDAGTMGNKLNTASSGGVDINALVAAVLAALNAATIPVDVQKMNGADVIGNGSVPDPWRGVGVVP